MEAPQAEDGRPRTPRGDIKIYCEVSFSHKIIPSNGPIFQSSPATVVTGRVDHGVGIVLKPHKSNHRFHSLLLIVEAKFQHGVDRALPQLVVYLASLHQTRVQR